KKLEDTAKEATEAQQEGVKKVVRAYKDAGKDKEKIAKSTTDTEIKESDRAVKKLKYNIEDVLVETKDANKQKEKEDRKYYQELARQADKSLDRYRENLLQQLKWFVENHEKQLKAEEDYAEEMLKLEEERLEELKREQQRYTDEAKQIYHGLEDALRAMSDETYEQKLASLDEEYSKKKAHLEALAQMDQNYADGVALLDQWYYGERAKLRQEEIAEHGSFIDRLVADWQRYSSEAGDFNAVAYNHFSSFISSASSAWTDSFYNLLTGNFDDLGDLFKDLLDNMLDEFLRTITRMATEAAAMQIVDWVSAIWASEGIWNVRGSDRGIPVIAHPGEMIIPKEVADAIRERIGGGGDRDSRAFNALRSAINDLPDRGLQGFLQGSARAWGMIGLRGLNLTLDRTITPAQFLGGWLGSRSILSSAFMGGIPGALDASLGFGPAARVGRGLAGALAVALGLPAGALAPALAFGIAGSFLGDAVADFLNIRQDEELRDYFESAYGYIKGRQLYATVQYFKRHIELPRLEDIGLTRRVKAMFAQGYLEKALREVPALADLGGGGQPGALTKGGLYGPGGWGIGAGIRGGGWMDVGIGGPGGGGPAPGGRGHEAEGGWGSGPGYQAGISYIGRTGTATVHTGEMILDRASATALRRYGIRLSVTGFADAVAEFKKAVAGMQTIIEQGGDFKDVRYGPVTGNVEIGDYWRRSRAGELYGWQQAYVGWQMGHFPVGAERRRLMQEAQNVNVHVYLDGQQISTSVVKEITKNPELTMAMNGSYGG
ncbi:MAG: hypothetical protein JRI89_14795, partial [Deltaproteobacteria bacterium]|nr:hypothetical protein [Deltaproteobacteria bacterium]